VTLDLPGGARADFVWQSHSGRPYTYFLSADGFTAADPNQPFIPNNRRLPSYSLLNLKISSPVPMWWGVDMTVLVDLRNATDALNVRWADSSGKVGGELEDPSAYYALRRLLLGLRARF
jgi:hypothetical protein